MGKNHLPPASELDDFRMSVELHLSQHASIAQATSFGVIIAERQRWNMPVELGSGVTILRGSFTTSGGRSGSPALGYNDVVVKLDGVTNAALREEGRSFSRVHRR